MTSVQIIMQVVGQIKENELIFASKLYAEQLSNAVTEYAYYQTLARMCKAGMLCRAAKGIYYRPCVSRYGIVPLPQKEIVAAFTESNKGTIVGYSLYNHLKLTTQVPKTIEVYSSQIEQQTKRICNVQLQFCDLIFTDEVSHTIHMLDVLQNFDEIQDLNYDSFIVFCEDFSSTYNEIIFEQVRKKVPCQKRTISFLREILNYYHVEHHLDKFLSSLSEYKHPTMEEIHEAAHIS